jgi:hypothetical protein
LRDTFDRAPKPAAPSPPDQPDVLATAALGLGRLVEGLPVSTPLAAVEALEVGGALLVYVTLSLRATSSTRRRD